MTPPSPTAPSSSKPGSQTSSILPDTQALKRVFDAEFQSLLSQARSALGNAQSHAPRIAEGALVRAWDARGQLQTQEQLKSFLANDVKQAAGRALARRGPHESSLPPEEAGPVDTAASWQRVVAATRQDPHAAQKEKDAAESMRNEVAEHMATASAGFPPVLTLGVLIALIVIIGGGLIWFNRAGTERAIANAIADPNGKVTMTTFGQLANMTLNDGTQIHLAPDSKLLVPRTYGGKIRVVRLDGAADFTVAPGQPGDFRVYLRNAILTAKGTRFVVSGYWSDRAQVVQVREGTVGVKIGEQTTTLTAGKALVVDTSGASHDATADEVEQATSWADGKFSFINRPLREVLPMLMRWYQVNADVRDLKLLDRPVTIHAPLDSSHVAIADVQKSGNLTYSDATRVFEDAAGKSPAKKK